MDNTSRFGCVWKGECNVPIMKDSTNGMNLSGVIEDDIQDLLIFESSKKGENSVLEPGLSTLSLYAMVGFIY